VSSAESCGLQRKYQLDVRLADRLVGLFSDWDRETGVGIEVMSGFRTREGQVRPKEQGRPAASPDVSTHTTCPSTGADIRISGLITTAVKARFGRIAIMNGLRWGGGGPVDPSTGIPLDWNHVDTGPRV